MVPLAGPLPPGVCAAEPNVTRNAVKTMAYFVIFIAAMPLFHANSSAYLECF